MSDLIDRQDAIDRVNGTGYADQIKNNLIFILRMLPSAQPKQADDLISRADAIEAVERAVTKEVARWSIKELPSAQPTIEERKTGRWIEVTDDSATINYACSVCYAGIRHQGFANYCPNCGAKMEVENE